MPSFLVVVHRIGGEPAPDVLRESCRAVLVDSAGIPIATDQIRLAYWADLAGHAAEVDDRGSFVPYSLAGLAAIEGFGAIKNGAIAAVEARLGDVFRKNAAPNNAVAAALANLLAFINGPMAMFVLKDFLHDVYAYFRGGIREAVKDRLRGKLDAVPAGSSVGLVGHSLGSVIALDVLVSDKPRVDWFCTLGSPLGYAPIQVQLGFDPATVTGVAGSWNNLADRIDPVALDDTLAHDFPNAGVADQLVVNEYENSAGLRNPHRLYGYLHTPEVGTLVRGFLMPRGPAVSAGS